MSEVSPDQSGRCRAGIVQKMVMVHPDDGDEEIADCVADDGRPEFEQSIEARSVRRAQVQGENCNNDCKNRIREGVQAFCLMEIPRSSFLFPCRCRPARQCLDAPIGPEQQASHAGGQRGALPLLRTFVDIRSSCRIGYTCLEKNRANAQRRAWRGLLNHGSPQPNLATFASPVTCCGVLTRSRPTPRYASGGVMRRDVWK
ncbi:hypothetical protein ABIF70_007354 [Bradyrhizobium japonicum]